MIVSITTDVAGQIGVNPRRVKIVSTDNLATVTAAGYLNGANMQGLAIIPTDFIDIVYSYNPATNSGTNVVMLPSIAAGVITLIETSGGTAGAKAASDNTSPTVASVEGAPVVVNDFAVFSDTAGSIKDKSFSATDATKTKVVMASAAVTSGNIAKFADTAGTVADGGFALHAGTTAAYAGGGTSNAYVTTNMTASSIVTAVILASTNSVSINKAVPGTNTLTVTFSADPGAGTTVNWISITPAVA